MSHIESYPLDDIIAEVRPIIEMKLGKVVFKAELEEDITKNTFGDSQAPTCLSISRDNLHGSATELGARVRVIGSSGVADYFATQADKKHAVNGNEIVEGASVKRWDQSGILYETGIENPKAFILIAKLAAKKLAEI